MDHSGPPVGQSFLHYRITEKIGEGGMGAVYKAADTHLDRPVAIKFLPPDKVSDPERRRRFVQEAKAASALRHPNIVVIHDIASDRGRDFIIMEFVDGQSLDLLIGHRGLKLNEALGRAVQIADGLAKAHAAGIIHRDLKPSNVMVTGDGLVKILDFGLAKLSEDVSSSEAGPTMTIGRDGKPRTEEGYILGTAAYMSPEQAEGKTIDARSDIFSFGVVLYEMLTGRRAFERDSRIKTLAAVLNEEPKPLSASGVNIPPELERILNRCLRKDPQRRWQTMSDLRIALQDLKEDSESGKLQAAVPAGHGKNKTVYLIAAAVLLVAAAAAIIILAVHKPDAPLEYEITPLTFDSGFTGGLTLSPGGNLMAYASDRDGHRNFDIWVQQVSGGKPLRLTDHPADDWFPSFSPDGSQVAFRSERDGGGIYLIDALGGEPRRIADKGFHPRFSPDGRFIAFVSVPPSLELSRFEAYLVSPKGGELRPVLRGFMFSFVGQGAALVWSPDGKYLIFRGRRADDPKSADWWVAPVDGGEPVRTHAIENLGLTTIVQYPFAWSGNHIYFVSGTTIEGINIFRAPISSKDWTVRGPAEPVTAGAGMKIFPAVMADGRVFFTQMTGVITTWSVAARPDDGEILAKPERLTQDLMQKFNPSISRDGSKAAFTAFGGAMAAKIGIRIKNLRTGQETTIPVRWISVDLQPFLSPDGSFLAYRDLADGKVKTFILEPGAAVGRELCEDCDLFDFFPDNRFALVRSTREQLKKRNLRTGEETVVLSSRPETVLNARLSPDGNWIAWIAGEPDGRVALRLTPIEGSSGESPDSITLIEAGYYLGSPAWSPNGRYLFFLSDKNDRTAIWVRELDPRTKGPLGREREIFVSPESRFMLNFPKGNGTIGVASDRIIFTVIETTGNIYMASPKTR